MPKRRRSSSLRRGTGRRSPAARRSTTKRGVRRPVGVRSGRGGGVPKRPGRQRRSPNENSLRRQAMGVARSTNVRRYAGGRASGSYRKLNARLASEGRRSAGMSKTGGRMTGARKRYRSYTGPKWSPPKKY